MTASTEMGPGAAWPIEIVQREAIEPTARLLADAFHDNPCYVFMHPRRALRRADLCAFFERNLRWREPLRLTFVVRGQHGDVLGTGSLEPAGSGVPRTFGKVFSHWLWPTLREQGPLTLARSIAAERVFARQQRLTAGGAEYWHIHALAVRADLRGRGLGSALVRQLLVEWRARDPAALLPVVLATQRETQLKFYARFGFRVRHRATLCKTLRAPGFASWFMRFEPRASGPPE